MAPEQYLIGIISILLGIVGFFLIRTMNKVDKISDKTDKNELNLAVLKNDHDTKHEHMVKEMGSLTQSIDRLITKIDKLTDKLSD